MNKEEKYIGSKSNQKYSKEAMDIFLSKPDLFPLHHYFCKTIENNLTIDEFLKSISDELLEKYELESDILKTKNKDIAADYVITTTAILTLKRNFKEIPHKSVVIFSRFLWINLFSERLERLGCFKRKSNKDWDLSNGYLQVTEDILIKKEDGTEEINSERRKITFKNSYYELWVKENQEEDNQ